MSEFDTHKRESLYPAAILGVCVMLGLILGGTLLGREIKAMKLADRYVTVKGLVEREVKADTAIWPLRFTEAGNDLADVYAKSEADRVKIVNFLAQQGVTPEEVTSGEISVVDHQANEYGNDQAKSRYLVSQTVTVQSRDVDKIGRAGARMAMLVQAGVVLSGGENGRAGGIAYKFTGLNALKPDMITEATRNARASADRFAQDSGSQVGSIRSANQGVFSITAAGAGAAPAEDESGGGGDNADASVMKKVRVVSTIDYYLIK